MDLWHTIVPEQSSFRLSPVKLEIKLKKSTAVRWLALEGNGDGGNAPAIVMATPDSVGKRTEKNWDKVVSEVVAAEPEEKPTGDAALNEFFKDLYSRSLHALISTH